MSGSASGKLKVVIVHACIRMPDCGELSLVHKQDFVLWLKLCSDVICDTVWMSEEHRVTTSAASALC